jgi:hypothetical protein
VHCLLPVAYHELQAFKDVLRSWPIRGVHRPTAVHDSRDNATHMINELEMTAVSIALVYFSIYASLNKE